MTVNGKAKGESLSNVFAAKGFIFAIVMIPLVARDLTRVSTRIFFTLDYYVLSYGYSRIFYCPQSCTTAKRKMGNRIFSRLHFNTGIYGYGFCPT